MRLSPSKPRAAQATPQASAHLVSFEHVAKRFFKNGTPFQALGDVHFDVRPGEFVSIVGPSGCGKSTLLNLTAGLMRPSSGRVFYRGTPVEAVNTSVGYVTQKDTLLPWRTVRENIAIPLEIQRTPRKERDERVNQVTEMVDLSGFANHYPSELSGGMRKRVVLARTIVYKPETLLMDEPFAALDAQLKLVLHQQLLRLWANSGMTVLFVTHDLAEAVTLSDRVVVLSAMPGVMRRIQQVDMPRPRNVFDIRFDDQFREVHEELWEILRTDMMAGEEM